jgi:hypothetical protein
MTSLKFTVVPHPPCSPDLALSDFWLFPKLKETLKGQHFSSDAEVEAAVCKWISIEPETFFMDGMDKWIERLKKYVSVQCVREINIFYSDIPVIMLHCQKPILYNWKPYLSITPRICVILYFA